MNFKSYFSILLVFFSISLIAQSDKEIAESTVTLDKIKGHITFLASDALKGRNTNSPELKIAAEYIKSRFISYGVAQAPGMDSYLQKVPMEIVKSASEAIIKMGDATLTMPDHFLIMDGSNVSTESEIVFINYGNSTDFENLDLKGKTVVSYCGDGEAQNPMEWFRMSRAKNEKAKELGAVALIELYASSFAPWNMLQRFFRGNDQYRLKNVNDTTDISFNHIWMNASDSTLVSQITATGSSLRLEVNGMNKVDFESQNIVGFVEGTDSLLKNEVIVYSAHYDHVGIGNANAEGDSIFNGARDNAVGTTTVLGVAENLSKHPTRRSAMFVLFTGEEKGLLGSSWFVDNSPIALQNIVYCFNSDNAGYNDTTRASIIGLTRTTAEPMIAEACETYGLKAMEDSAKEQGLFDRSDNVNFARKGIPAPTYSLGFTSFNAEIFKYYHQATDQADNLNYNYLEKFFRSYVLSSRMIANGDERPFWTEGDKYYEAGKNLYNSARP